MKLHELIDAYKASPDFKALARNSQVNYSQMIEAMITLMGKTFPVEEATPRWVMGGYTTLQSAYGTSKAQQICKVARKVWNWGYRNELLIRNPWSAMGLKQPKPRTTVITHDQFTMLFLANEEVYNQGPVAIEMWKFLHLLWETGQRPGDILSLTTGNIRPEGILIKQQKTGKEILIPLSKPIFNELLISNKLNIFSDSFYRNHGNYFTAIRKRAKLEYIQLRDFRRTVMTEMASGGATDSQIRAVSGHSGHSKIPDTVYVQRDGAMAADGLAKRSRVMVKCEDCGSTVPCEWCRNHIDK